MFISSPVSWVHYGFEKLAMETTGEFYWTAFNSGSGKSNWIRGDYS
jgi:hypothetical protein